VIDKEKELKFDFDNTPRRFIDVETNDFINLYPDTVKEGYESAVGDYFKNIKLKCGQYQIKYVEVDINKPFDKVLTTYMVERQKFI
jgi:hypothetical protein